MIKRKSKCNSIEIIPTFLELNNNNMVKIADIEWIEAQHNDKKEIVEYILHLKKWNITISVKEYNNIKDKINIIHYEKN